MSSKSKKNSSFDIILSPRSICMLSIDNGRLRSCLLLLLCCKSFRSLCLDCKDLYFRQFLVLSLFQNFHYKCKLNISLILLNNKLLLLRTLFLLISFYHKPPLIKKNIDKALPSIAHTIQILIKKILFFFSIFVTSCKSCFLLLQPLLNLSSI